MGYSCRYHDFNEYVNKVTPDLFEFHLSYTDMDLEISNFLGAEYPQDFVVHAPELFSGGRLMDLASIDKNYRSFSIEQTQRVIDITRRLKRYFPKTAKPMIIANVGGFMDRPIPSEEVPEYYLRLSDSLSSLDLMVLR